jgi:hypothetical protein
MNALVIDAAEEWLKSMRRFYRDAAPSFPSGIPEDAYRVHIGPAIASMRASEFGQRVFEHLKTLGLEEK